MRGKSRIHNVAETAASATLKPIASPPRRAEHCREAPLLPGACRHAKRVAARPRLLRVGSGLGCGCGLLLGESFGRAEGDRWGTTPPNDQELPHEHGYSACGLSVSLWTRVRTTPCPGHARAKAPVGTNIRPAFPAPHALPCPGLPNRSIGWRAHANVRSPTSPLPCSSKEVEARYVTDVLLVTGVDGFVTALNCTDGGSYGVMVSGQQPPSVRMTGCVPGRGWESSAGLV